MTLAKALQKIGFEVFLLGDRRSEVDGSASIEGIPAYWIEAAPPNGGYRNALAYWRRLWAELRNRRQRYDVLHIHSANFEQSAAVPIAKLLRKRVLVRSSISGEFAGLRRSKSGRIQRHLLRLCDEFVVLSERLSEEYIASGLPRSKLNLINNGVDQGLYHPVSRPEKLALRQELSLPEEGRLLVYHGVFMERKSLHWLVDAIAASLERLDLTLVMVGGPARDESTTGYAARLQRQVSSTEGADRIVVRGYEPQVHRYLQAADLYVLPSTAEGLPNALLEAMSVGLVPIASRTSGSEDVVEDGVSGFLFTPRDSASLLQCLDLCCRNQDPEQLAGYSAAALDRIRTRFGIEATLQQYANLYRRMINHSSVGADQ